MAGDSKRLTLCSVCFRLGVGWESLPGGDPSEGVGMAAPAQEVAKTRAPGLARAVQHWREAIHAARRSDKRTAQGRRSSCHRRRACAQDEHSTL
eukprot:2267981-Pleurochrysis_carterae.AAC.3